MTQPSMSSHLAQSMACKFKFRITHVYIHAFNTMKSPPQAIPDGGRELELFNSFRDERIDHIKTGFRYLLGGNDHRPILGGETVLVGSFIGC